MTTFQMIAKETGAPLSLVKTVKRDIIGNRHTATTKEIHEIKKRIEKEMGLYDIK